MGHSSSLSRLTLVVPVRDRPHYTQRLLNYLEQVEFDGSIIVADGSTKTVIDESDARSRWPDLRLRYLNFPRDATYSTFLKKSYEAFSQVATPYSVWACDDDFYNMSALSNAVEFLDENEAYAAYGGEVVDFAVQPLSDSLFSTANFVFGQLSIQVEGRHCAGRYEMARSADQDHAEERVRTQVHFPAWEAVHSQTFWPRILRAAHECGVFSSSQLGYLVNNGTVLQGKYYHSAELLMLRQDNTDIHEGAQMWTSAVPSRLHLLANEQALATEQCLRNSLPTRMLGDDLTPLKIASIQLALSESTMHSWRRAIEAHISNRSVSTWRRTGNLRGTIARRLPWIARVFRATPKTSSNSLSASEFALILDEDGSTHEFLESVQRSLEPRSPS